MRCRHGIDLLSLARKAQEVVHFLCLIWQQRARLRTPCTLWRQAHPDEEIPDGHVFTQPWPATGKEKAAGRRDKAFYYQYRHDRARRTLHGIDEQVKKAQLAVDGKAPVKRNRFIALDGATKSVNRELEARARARARAVARIKGYAANLQACPTARPSPQTS